MSPRLAPDAAALLDAAAALVARGEAPTVAAIADATGVARGTVYKRLGGPEAIAAALKERGVAAPDPDLREKLLDAVGRVFRARGLAGLTLEGVAQEAGVSPITVYRRFGDRKGLLQAFVAERTPRRLAAQLPVDGSGDPAADLLLLTRESLAFVRAHPEVYLLQFSADPEARELLAAAREGSASTRELTARVIDRAFPDPTGRTVQAFWGVMTFVAFGGTGDVEADARFVVDTFLHGVSR